MSKRKTLPGYTNQVALFRIYMDMRQAEARRIAELERRRDNIPVRVTTDMHDLVQRASAQNFVPVVDDKDTFIGIITRSSIIRYCSERLFSEADKKSI